MPVRTAFLAPALSLLCAAALLPDAACGQHHLYTFRGELPGDHFGIAVDGAGDVNRDGFADVIVGAQANQSGASNGNYAKVYSGRDGTILHTFRGRRAGDFFGLSVAGAGDVDRDGHADLIVGASEFGHSNRGYAQVFSGRTGAVLHLFVGDGNGDSFGIHVDGAGDVNADGHADLIVGADRAAGSTGYARVFSGKDGTPLFTFSGSAMRDSFGLVVTGAGDVDRNGHADILVAAPFASGLAGYARLYSGRDGKVLHTFTGRPGSRGLFGSAAAAAGDVNADGYPDLLIGAPNELDPGNRNTGFARVFSGRDFSALHTFYGDGPGIWFGRSLDGIGDVDRDGHADLLVGAYRGANPQGIAAGYVRVYSGKNGRILQSYYGTALDDLYGYGCGGAGDVNGDGLPDVIVGAQGADDNGTDSGSASVLSVAELTLVADRHEFSLSRANVLKLEVRAGVANQGRGYWILGSATGTSPGVRLGGLTIPLNPDPWTDLTIALANGPNLVNTSGLLDAQGVAVAEIRGGPLNLPGAIGLTLHHACLVHDGANRFLLASNPVPLSLTR